MWASDRVDDNFLRFTSLYPLLWADSPSSEVFEQQFEEFRGLIFIRDALIGLQDLELDDGWWHDKLGVDSVISDSSGDVFPAFFTCFRTPEKGFHFLFLLHFHLCFVPVILSLYFLAKSALLDFLYQM